MSNNIEGKVIIITGASSGMGEAAARHLAAEGASVVLAARRSDRIDTLANEIPLLSSAADTGTIVDRRFRPGTCPIPAFKTNSRPCSLN